PPWISRLTRINIITHGPRLQRLKFRPKCVPLENTTIFDFRDTRTGLVAWVIQSTSTRILWESVCKAGVAWRHNRPQESLSDSPDAERRIRSHEPITGFGCHSLRVCRAFLTALDAVR